MSLKFYHNYFCFLAFLICSSCNENLVSKEDQEKSQRVFIEGEKLLQGSTESMLRLEKAIEIDPYNCDAVRELSVAYLKRGLAHQWKLQFDKAVECDPILWQPYRGYLYLSFYRDYEKAIADFDASDTLTPNFTDAPQGQSVDYWRGIAYLGLKDYKNALNYFNKYIRLETDEWGEDQVEVTGFLYRGIVLFKTNNYEQALKDFDKVLYYNEDHSADAKYYKALILKASNPVKAKQLVTSAIKDFNMGYFNQRDYVEILMQIYIDDLNVLNQELKRRLDSNL